MKTCISSYSYGRLIREGKMDYFQVMDKTKELGFDAIEFSTIAVPEGKTLAEFAVELKAYADKIGLPIASYTIGANFMQADVAAEIERIDGGFWKPHKAGYPPLPHSHGWNMNCACPMSGHGYWHYYKCSYTPYLQ